MPLKLRHSFLALCSLMLLAWSAGARALDLGVNLGGVNVGVSVGGDSGIGVGVGVGDSNVDIGIGGSDGNNGTGLGVDLDVDLDGDGVPETSSGGLSVVPLGQDSVLKAVQTKRALPLEDILTRARLVAEGEIIDAQLIQVRRILVYEIKVLGKSGDVQELYFYARSGALVTPK